MTEIPVEYKNNKLNRAELEKIDYLKQQGFKNPYRVRRLIEDAIKFNKLDLTNLVVFTEAASRNYVVTPIIAAMAGAKVYAITSDSPYGKAKDVELEFKPRAVLVTERRADVVKTKGFLDSNQRLIIRDGLREVAEDIIKYLEWY